MSHNRLLGPREVLEVILCQYENGTVFYQFNGMDGRRAQPVEVHRLLTAVANALTQSTAGVVAPSPSSLLPEEAPV